MHTKSITIEIILGSQTNDIIEELFESVLQRYRERLEESMKGSELFFDNVNLLHYHLLKRSLKRTGLSYIDSSEWLKIKKATINLNYNDDSCIQYALSVALNYQNSKKDPQRILKVKLFINK